MDSNSAWKLPSPKPSLPFRWISSKKIGPMTVVVNTTDLTATAGSDYTGLSSHTATIAAGATSTTVTVLVTDDNLVENSESLTVNLSDAKFNGATDPMASRYSEPEVGPALRRQLNSRAGRDAWKTVVLLPAASTRMIVA